MDSPSVQPQPCDSPDAVRSAHARARKANILLLTGQLGIGGAEIVIRDLARTLDRRRFNVSVCCLKALGPTGMALAAEGIDVVVPPDVDPARVNYFSARQLWRVIREKRIDLVHSHTTHGLVDAAACRCLCRSVKVVHTFHFGNYPHCPARTRLMEAVSSRVVDGLVAVGEAQRERIKHTYRLADGAISTVHNGVGAAVSTGESAEFRRGLGADQKILVGTIAHLCPQKGLYDLLAVARRVRDRRQDLHFVVVGGGDLHSDLERRKQELDLGDTVTFTGLVTDAARRTLPAFDIYLHPSLWEAMSISVLEAMAAAKGIVATNVGESAYVLAHGVDGLLCEPGDIEGMAAAILTLAADPGLRKGLGSAAARTVAERLTVEHMTRAYEELYLNVLQWDAPDHAER